jgi:hypothetical protein
MPPVGNILSNTAKASGNAALNAMIGQANAGNIAGFFKQIMKDSSGSGGSGQPQGDRETMAVARQSNAVARETLQSVRINTNKFYQMGDTLEDVRFGIENIAKIFALQEFNAAGEAAMNNMKGGGGLGLMTSAELLGLMSALALPVAGGLAAHYLDIDETKPGNSAVGSWINENIPGAASIDDFVYKMTGGAVGTSMDDPRYSWNKDKAEKAGADLIDKDTKKDDTKNMVNRAPSASGEVEIRDKKIDIKELLSFKATTITFKLKENAVALSADEANRLGWSMSRFTSNKDYSNAVPSRQNTGSRSTFGGSTGPVSPNGTSSRYTSGNISTAKEAVDFLVGKGWTREQAAGIVGNLQAESNLNVADVGDGGQAYGIAQWHPDRQANFRKYKGKDIRGSTLVEQLDFLNWELSNTERGAGFQLKAAKTAEEAAVYFDKYFERSKASMGIDINNRSTWEKARKRINYANAIMGAVNKSQTDTTKATPVTPATPSIGAAKSDSGSENAQAPVQGQTSTPSPTSQVVRNRAGVAVTGQDISASSVKSDPLLKPKPTVTTPPPRDRQDSSSSDNVVKPPPSADKTEVQPLKDLMTDYFDYGMF